ncbi:MAG TPA: terminase small subunit [Microvirga sp.]|jgi:phage terminase small subunit
MPRSLTPKQQRFVDEYLVDLNGTQAALRAGYSTRTAASIAHENLTKPEVQTAIVEAQTARAQRVQVTADRVIEEIARIAFADIRNVLDWDEAGVRLKPSILLGEGAAACIAAISQTADGRLQVRLHDKLSALEKLIRYLALDTKAGPAPLAIPSSKSMDETMALLDELLADIEH